MPLDAAALDALALGYLARYATTRARLAHYLRRKIAERGWDGTDEPPIAAIAERMAVLGYVDDAAFAVARESALGRRGYSAARIGHALRAAGVDAAAAAPSLATAAEQAWERALAFARRRRIGPFATIDAAPDARRRALGAMLRAGHPLAIARRIVAAAPGEVPERDD